MNELKRFLVYAAIGVASLHMLTGCVEVGGSSSDIDVSNTSTNTADQSGTDGSNEE
jgi:hypothetical protein